MRTLPSALIMIRRSASGSRVWRRPEYTAEQRATIRRTTPHPKGAGGRGLTPDERIGGAGGHPVREVSALVGDRDGLRLRCVVVGDEHDRSVRVLEGDVVDAGADPQAIADQAGRLDARGAGLNELGGLSQLVVVEAERRPARLLVDGDHPGAGVAAPAHRPFKRAALRVERQIPELDAAG